MGIIHRYHKHKTMKRGLSIGWYRGPVVVLMFPVCRLKANYYHTEVSFEPVYGKRLLIARIAFTWYIGTNYYTKLKRCFRFEFFKVGCNSATIIEMKSPSQYNDHVPVTTDIEYNSGKVTIRDYKTLEVEKSC